ncbi:small subunit rRNA processing factor, putative [Plasmodium relictum]|uniref:Small subunit rRNA processing factor, putative n=1 Tax=Plasmodium relictum TaxID=85471 RepID=A0A1J1HDT6_PLARL|nr:small subunit rRNA processing factor, putative [Plasmodium relictum]CRH03701.1 small subunit rRNA processing factor, putative [Plasmodium relictum]
MKILSKLKKNEKKNNEKKEKICSKSKGIKKKKSTYKNINERLLNNSKSISLETNKNLIIKKKEENILNNKGELEKIINKNDQLKKKKCSNTLKNDEFLIKKKMKINHTPNELKNREKKEKEKTKEKMEKGEKKKKKKNNNIKEINYTPLTEKIILTDRKKKKDLKKYYKNEIEKKAYESNLNFNKKNENNENQKNNESKRVNDEFKNGYDDSRCNNRNAKKRYMNKVQEDNIKKKCIIKEEKENKKKYENKLVKKEKEKNIKVIEQKKNIEKNKKNNIIYNDKKKKDKTINVKEKVSKPDEKNENIYKNNIENKLNFADDNKDICANENVYKDDQKDLYNNEKENIKMTFEVTNRFTVLGCDWDNISSVDVFYLFESYYNFEKRKKKKFDYSKSRAVKKVTIYTSKYGEKKLKYEEEHGPLINFDLLKKKKKNGEAIYRNNNLLDYIGDENENENKKLKKKKFLKKNSNQMELKNDMYNIADIYNDEDREKENEKIRLYQIQRSRYYFALVECYNKEIVEFLYEELNDMDADFCINYLDLRIIDDNCSLDDYKIKEYCDKIPENYKFYYCVTTALKHTYAKSSWDENPRRKKILSTRFTEEKLRELDLKEYLANSSSDEENYCIDDNYNNSESFNKSYSKENYRKLLLGDILNEEDLKGEKPFDHNESLPNNYNEEISSDENEKQKKLDNSKEDSYYYNEIKEETEENNNNDLHHQEKYKQLMDKNMKITNTDQNIMKSVNSSKNKSKVGKGNPEGDDDSDKENEVMQVFKNVLINKEQKEDKQNPWEKYLDKVKMKKKMKKKAYLESLKKKDEEIKKIITKKTNKRKKEQKIKNKVDYNSEKINENHVVDCRFADLYKNKDFNLDITNPNFKKTKFNEQILQKKL